jgi:hypothetical protein
MIYFNNKEISNTTCIITYSLQENRVHSSVPRNITVIYSSVPESRNIAATDEHMWWYIRRLTDKCIGLTEEHTSFIPQP